MFWIVILAALAGVLLGALGVLWPSNGLSDWYRIELLKAIGPMAGAFLTSLVAAYVAYQISRSNQDGDRHFEDAQKWADDFRRTLASVLGHEAWEASVEASKAKVTEEKVEELRRTHAADIAALQMMMDPLEPLHISMIERSGLLLRAKSGDERKEHLHLLSVYAREVMNTARAKARGVNRPLVLTRKAFDGLSKKESIQAEQVTFLHEAAGEPQDDHSRSPDPY